MSDSSEKASRYLDPHRYPDVTGPSLVFGMDGNERVALVVIGWAGGGRIFKFVSTFFQGGLMG
ncbi:hypothetical protein PGT21_024854 [Puccinia graminis f. sp. tritici]|uniref:Uncharacterized protein n=1 Tax=Puccinia graminis f. sp. tritici TaxID=56615 RepID=A0A5B0PA88_PUCGR|nr:hypothetical protein PGT21_024854 [Puccinia graminis f. sp. tritici]